VLRRKAPPKKRGAGRRDVRGSQSWLAQMLHDLQQALQGGGGSFRGPGV
jgi:hypothetical protein